MSLYKLVFEEDFLVDGRPDEQTWNHEVGERWSNNESQCYVNDCEHSYIKDSILHIRATFEKGAHCPYKSARITTYGKKHFQYGKFVISAKLPKGRGSWPAIWFMGEARKDRVPWPRCGEIDLMEYAGNRSHQVTCAIHTETYNHKIHTEKFAKHLLDDASDVFHDYIMEWTKDELIFMVDDHELMRVQKQPTDTFAEWPFDQPFYMILNLAVGGWYAGSIVDEDLPFEFQVDSIRIYQKD